MSNFIKETCLYQTIKRKYKNIFTYSNKVPRIAIKEKILFIHVPKAAGSTVSLNLYGVQIGHKKAKDYFISDSVGYYKVTAFAFVRDPIARFESAYYYLKSGGMDSGDRNTKSKYIDKYSDINEFVSFVDEEFINSGEVIHFLPQHEYIYYDNTCIVDKVFKLERIEDVDFKKEIGISLDLSKKNVSERENTSLLNERSINKLKLLYEKDFYLFGYNLK
ncbi:sulfotransferase family 2 domain-containing protein [Vibrio sp. 10N.247.311.59]|uniref:sulfotransferase family 2 domain-containing protein n=1 Tax=Vibrio sp. 10N.247.311.59 TaxID=3229989 RepID=UPI00354EAA6A